MRRIFSALAGIGLSLNVMAADINFEELEGQVVYLDFWASWCGPCRESFPWMQSMHEKYADQGLVIIAVNLDQEAYLAKKFLAKYQPDFRIEYDGKGEMAEVFKVESMPTSFLIGRDGKARKKHKGFHSDDMNGYEEEIRSLLEEAQ